MTAITIFLTFLLLLAIMAAGAWAAYLTYRKLKCLEKEQRRINLAAIEDSNRSEKRVNEMALRLEVLERNASDASQRPAHSVNYTQRSQMLRMVRRGDSAEQVSSALGVPANQVRLLMKLPGAIPGTPPAKEPVRKPIGSIH